MKYQLLSLLALFTLFKNLNCFLCIHRTYNRNYIVSGLRYASINRIKADARNSIDTTEFRNETEKSSKYLYFTGAGVYFWWQAGDFTTYTWTMYRVLFERLDGIGAAKYIQSNYDYKNLNMVGASAGSLTALLLICGCDFDRGAKVALNIARKYGVYERKTGMLSIDYFSLQF